MKAQEKKKKKGGPIKLSIKKKNYIKALENS